MPCIDIKKFNNQIVFFGFCPGADFSRRLDTRWKELGICEFYYFDSPMQVKRFATIEVGDLIVLKKRQVIGKTMRVYGYGIVTGITKDNDGHRVLKVDWSSQEQVIEVPLMGCNATIDIRAIEKVRAEMPDAFFEWLNQGAGISNLPKPASKTEAAVLDDSEIDEDSSEQELLAAANRGNVDAMEYLGSGYANGKWGDEDPVKSFKWYMKAAEHGGEFGMFNAASYLVQGDVVEQNMELALLFLKKLAVRSDFSADANHNLGIIYENGIGNIPKDVSKAKECYLKAIDLGSNEAIEALQSLPEDNVSSQDAAEEYNNNKISYSEIFSSEEWQTLKLGFAWSLMGIANANQNSDAKKEAVTTYLLALLDGSFDDSDEFIKVDNELSKQLISEIKNNWLQFIDDYFSDSRGFENGMQEVGFILNKYLNNDLIKSKVIDGYTKSIKFGMGAISSIYGPPSNDEFSFYIDMLCAMYDAKNGNTDDSSSYKTVLDGLDSLEKSGDNKQENDYKQNICNHLLYIGLYKAGQDQLDEALTYYIKALPISKNLAEESERIEIKNDYRSLLDALAGIYEKQGNVKDAMIYYKLGLNIAQELADKYYLRMTYVKLIKTLARFALFEKSLGNFNGALEKFTQCIPLISEASANFADDVDEPISKFESFVLSQMDDTKKKMNLNADTASKNEPEKNKKSAYKLSPHGSNPDLDSVDVNTIPQTDYSDEAFTKSPQAKKSETDDQVKDRINLPPGYTPSTEEEYMNPYQLEYFRQILLAEYDNLHDAFQGVDIDTFDENTPDGKTIARGRKLLYKIENILKTIDDETYGYCVDTGEEIGLQRLLERPMAERTTEAQERFDDAKKKMNLSANKASKSEPEKIKNSASKLSPHGFNPDVESVDLNTLPQTDYSDEAFSKSREANKSETIARADRNKPEKISKTTKPSIDYSIYENTKNITSKKLKQNDKTNNADEIFAKAVHYLKQKDQKQALRHMKDAAKKGSEEAMYELGLSYTHGLFSDIDYKIALGYYQEAANLKNSKAMHNLAIAYSLGRGVNVNYDVAFQWFEKAATYFNIDSINALGVCYESGQGVDIDLEKAAGYFETAMNNGHVLAARNLANYYYRGKHFEVDRNKAADIWESLAKAGDILSAKDIGICYENGQGRDKNLKQARAWYKIAADGGNEDAIKYLKELK